MEEEDGEDGGVGDKDCDADVEDVDDAIYADADAQCCVSSTADVGDRLLDGVEHIECVTGGAG